MYVILVYDCGEKRVGKMLKLCRQYLNWIQNSVFEGEISEVKLKELKMKAKVFMNEDEDSLIIFSGRTEKWLDKQVIGKERSAIDNFLWHMSKLNKTTREASLKQASVLWHIETQHIKKLSMCGIFTTFAHRQLFKSKTATNHFLNIWFPATARAKTHGS